MDKESGVREVRRLLPIFVVTLYCLANVGCASTPRWVGGIDRNEYYHQGVGHAKNTVDADRAAILELCASIHGIDVESVQEAFQREHGVLGNQVFEEDFTNWVKTYVGGKVPAESRVVDRWSGDEGQWAYALVERPGMVNTVNELHADHMAGIALHAFVPGWAQFQQQRDQAAWTYIGGFGIGLVTGITGYILAADQVDRRDRERQGGHKDMEAYHDDQANRYYWISMAGYAFMGLSYGINLVDGLTVRVEPYKLLTSFDSRGIEVVFRF